MLYACVGGTIIEEEQLDKISDNKLESEHSLNQDTGGSTGGGGSKKGKFKSLFSDCHCCKPILQKYNPLPSRPNKSDRMKYAFTCPPHGKVGSLSPFDTGRV